ncbi:hypothetical protein POL68_31550 [Stigmatella sp. ncwal1]|uniref:Uncharacterized protein n=1 Tax=Stigmatella ashevillensis TaxID=2995309 RepID=A0ABT5DHC6_9BACT|nr:hypothetical protein [Stigmatella ashevillena]MDC0713040.1 hypothetical protein [Stigmatella ashevillena]
MKSRQGSGPQRSWGHVLLGSAAGLLGALVGRKLARRQVPEPPSVQPPSVQPPSVQLPTAQPFKALSSFALLDSEFEQEASSAEEAPSAQAPRFRRGPNGREHYEALGTEPTYSL